MPKIWTIKVASKARHFHQTHPRECIANKVEDKKANFLVKQSAFYLEMAKVGFDGN